MFNKILLASDGSEDAMNAAAVAAEMATKFGSKVVVVNVFTMPPMVTPYVGSLGLDLDPVALNRIADEAQAAVCKHTGEVLAKAGVSYETRNEIGNPAEVIITTAEEEKCDLIVLGSRGLSGVQSFFLGSVSDRVTHHAHCPVLIVR